MSKLNNYSLGMRSSYFLFSAKKGYAFIQYGDEMDALNAVFAQDGQMIVGQAIGKFATENIKHNSNCVCF